MEPNSPPLVLGLFAAAGGLLVLFARRRHPAVRIPAGALALTLSTVAGMAVVNDYYSYYQTWSQLGQDVTDGYGPATPATSSGMSRFVAGRVESVPLPGRLSGINRTGLVYLPPQYFQPRYAHTAFPAVELIHGSPGSPTSWTVHLNIAAVSDELLAHHASGPMILVMPTMNAGRDLEECLNTPGTPDDTYITQDVRADIEAQFRVSTVAAEWGIAGYSSGGYCAANLALRHAADFGAAAIIDGYFRPQDGPAAKDLRLDPTALAANDPLRQAALAGRGGGPLPAFWVSTGTGNLGDEAGAQAFVAALRPIEAVPLYRVLGAGHNVYAWQPAIPYALGWLWAQIAPPSLRVLFPLNGDPHDVNIQPSPPTFAGKPPGPAQPPVPPSTRPGRRA